MLLIGLAPSTEAEAAGVMLGGLALRVVIVSAGQYGR
jgi:hypothetical protein